MALNFGNIEKPRQAILIYGDAGVGKSVSLATLLKVVTALKSGLKVRIYCLEDNSLPAIIRACQIYGITELEPKQLVICTPPQGKINSATDFQDTTSDAFYQNIVKGLFNFSGTDVATGETVSLGNIGTWDKDTVLVLDGLTNFQYACQFRGKVVAKNGNNDKDARAVFFAGQTTLTNGIKQLLSMYQGHFVLLAHEATSDEAAIAKYRGLKPIHPAVGTRSIVSQFCGNFSYVFYAKKVEISQQYYWSVSEKGTYSRHSLDLDKVKEHKLTLDKLPQDFSHPVYDFF